MFRYEVEVGHLLRNIADMETLKEERSKQGKPISPIVRMEELFDRRLHQTVKESAEPKAH